MNKLIEQLMYNAGLTASGCWDQMDDYDHTAIEKFAEMIVKEHIDLLRQEWYDLNNLPNGADESPRDIGLRVGKKGEIIVLMEKIKKHFGVKE